MELFSINFVYLFLPFSIIAYYLTPHVLKNFSLLLISFLFYWLVEPQAFLYLLASLFFDFTLVQLMKYYDDNYTIRAGIVAASVIKTLVCILLFSQNNGQLIYLGVNIYMLTSMGYIVDIYDYKAPYEDSFANFSLMCAFFGKLYIGPMVTYNNIMPQIKKRKESLSQMSGGIILFTNGLAKKVIIADNTNLMFNSLSAIPKDNLSVIGVWAMVIAAAFSIYFYMSAFTDMARGIGKLFALEFPKNFYYPYQAKSIGEFFSRFNMSIVDFIKRYVCFDLIGYKHFKIIGSLQLLAVGALFGLWFRIDLRFAAWGFFIVIFVLLEKYVYGKYMQKLPSFLQRIITFGIVIMSFVVLVSENFTTYLFYIKAMFGLNINSITSDELLYIMNSNYILIIICFILSTNIFDHITRFMDKKYPKTTELISVIFNIAVLLLTTSFML